MILFRAVSRLELLDLARAGGFRGGDVLGLEAELFALSAEDARYFSEALQNPYIVEVDVPEALASRLPLLETDGRPIAVRPGR